MEKRQGKIPEVRFPEFKEPWEHKKLSELLSESKQLNTDLKYGKDEVLSVSGELGCVNQIEHLGRSYAGASVHNYGVVETGDIVYTKSPLKANPFGIIKLNKGKEGIVSTLYAIYKPKPENAIGEFIDHYFTLDANTNRYLRPLVKKGAKNDMKINNAYVLHDRIFVPTISEQKRISEYLSIVDNRINQLKKKKFLLEQYKKGVIQKIFSQEIRFKDKNGNVFPEWDENSLFDLANRVTRKNTINCKNVLTISAQHGLINQLDFFNNSVSAKDLTGYYLLKKGEFAYNRSYSNGYPMGATKRLSMYEDGVVSTLYICFSFKNLDNADFFEHYFESGKINRELSKCVSEGARNHGLLNVGLDDFFKIKVLLPSIEEQRRISQFLNSINNRVKEITIQLDSFKEWKKGLLQKMFCV